MPSQGFGNYLVESRRPLTSLAFLAVPLLVYELGVLTLGPAAVQNGVDAWLRGWLRHLGFGQYFLLPGLTVSGLLAWHHTTGEKWWVSWGVAWGMLVECTLLAAVLFVIGYLQISLFDQMISPGAIRGAISREFKEWLGNLIGYLGAGIYEEVLFRLILLALCSALIGMIGATERWKTIGAVAVTSVAFSAAHLFAESFQLRDFLFRIVAGVFFAVLFLRRGFGIAAGTHAGFDIFVGLLYPS